MFRPVLLDFLVVLACSISFQSCFQPELKRGDEDWSFITFGDIRRGFGVYSKICKNIRNIEPIPDLSFCLGDIMHVAGNEAEWENFWRYSKPLTEIMPYYFARGNHEGNDDVSETIFKEQIDFFRGKDSTFYYAIHHKKQHFIILDTYIRGQSNAVLSHQLKWLKNQLDSTAYLSNVENVFILMHHPLYPQGKYKKVTLLNADEMHGLFKEYSKIRAVFASHEHCYSYYNKEGIHYFITGGAGAQLYYGYGGDVYHYLKISFFEDQKRVNIKVIGIFNEIVEDFDL